MTRLLLLLLLNWEAGLLSSSSSSPSCPLESFHCQEGGLVPLCLESEGQPGCEGEGCQRPRSLCRDRGCRCGNSSGPCLPFERFCDQHPDCPDGSDEDESLCLSLVGPLEEDHCESDEFQCSLEAECLPLSFKCDGHPDCHDGADEEGCGTDQPETPRAPPHVTPKGPPPLPETAALEPLTITAIVALLVSLVAAAALTLCVWRKAKPRLARLPLKAAIKQLILHEEP